MDMSGIPAPVMNWEASNLAEAWKKFHQHVQLIFEGPLKAKSEEEKVSYLLLWVGDKGRDVYNTWAKIEGDDAKKLEPYYTRFLAHCQPKLNPIFARYKFNTELQGTSTIDQFVTRLKLLAVDCDFKTEGKSYADSMIRDRIVFGTSSVKVRTKLIDEGDKLTLEKAVQMGQNHEYSENQKKSMSSPAPTQEVHAVKQDKQGTSGKPQKRRSHRRQKQNHPVSRKKDKCTRCGYDSHTQGKTCPAMGKTCSFCSKKNHFAQCCKSKQSHSVSEIHGYASSSSSDSDFYVETISTDHNSNQAFVSLSLGPKLVPIQFKLDTGSQVNVLPERVFHQLKHKLPLEKPERHLSAYTGDKLNVLGRFMLNCKYKDLDSELEFYVVKTQYSPILGLKSCLDLQLIKLVYSVNHADTTGACDSPGLDRASILSEYADVFDGLGLIPGECKIHLDPNAIPVVHPPRRVPIAIRDLLKKELDRMEKAEVITKVITPTKWVNSLVAFEKAPGKLRVCLDPQDLNNAILRPHYPMRTLDDIMPQLSGARYFTKLDARSGYWAIKLEKESSFLTTFNTPYGRYRFLRLPFGIKSSQDEFQFHIDQCFEGLSGVETIVDDILVYGRTKAEHDENLRKVLERSREKGIKLNADKLEVGLTEVHYFGNVLSAEGLKPDPQKVAAIRDMNPPRDKSELETVLGMINFLARFAPNLSEVTSPMRQLLQKQAEFVWDSPQQESFDKVKDILTQTPGPVLAYYDASKELILQVDASKYGLGATLIQEGRPLAYASKALTPTEVNYAQIEKEMYAILFGAKRFYQFVYGRHVIVQTDHKLLVAIKKKPLHAAPARLQRMLLQLQKFDLEFQHLPGKSIPLADTLSRKFTQDTYPEIGKGLEAHVFSVVGNLPVSDKKLAAIKYATENDQQFVTLTDTILNGWPEQRKSCPTRIAEFWNHRDELTVIDGIVFRGQCLVIPPSLRQSMLESVHIGHMGMTKCTRRAKDIMFWPKMSSEIEEMISSCSTCLERRDSNCKEPLISHSIPERPWQVVSTDLFTWNDQDFVVVVDHFSRYIEVEKLPSSRSSSVISKMKSIFARHGLAEKVISDNGPCYSSHEFADFAKEWDFSHITSSPHFPQSNGLAEKSVQTIKRMFSKARADHKDPYLCLLEYRNTPLEEGFSPSQLLMGRRLRSVLPSTHTQLLPETIDIGKFRQKLLHTREKQKSVHDKGAHSLKPLELGETVRIKYNDGLWKPAVVSEKHDTRSFTVQTPSGGSYRRNRRDLLKTGEKVDPNHNDSEITNYLSNSAAVLDDANILSAPTLSPVKTSPKQETQSVSTPVCGNPYITRFGRVCKPKIKVSM